MRIISWNVNGLRASVRKGFVPWLETCGADVVAIQEVRCQTAQLPAEIKHLEGWHLELVAAQRKGYSGVAVFSRQPPDDVEVGLGVEEFDLEGRLQLLRFGALWVVNGYFPNGNGPNRDLSRIPYKLRFYRSLFDRLEAARRGGDRILVMGDFNTAHEDIDLARPKQNRKTSGFRPEERQELDRWLTAGWVDTFRHVEPGSGHYSWWRPAQGRAGAQYRLAHRLHPGLIRSHALARDGGHPP